MKDPIARIVDSKESEKDPEEEVNEKTRVKESKVDNSDEEEGDANLKNEQYHFDKE